MKATGIVRRIDELGRVVIPKEIRRTLRIREGDPLEIFTDREGEIILKKYSPIGELTPFARQYAEALVLVAGNTVCITDRDQFVAVAGTGKKDLLGQSIHKELEAAIDGRESVLANAKEEGFKQVVMNNVQGFEHEVICPIISEGDAIGAVVILGKEGSQTFGEMERKLAVCAAAFLGKQMEQ